MESRYLTDEEQKEAFDELLKVEGNNVWPSLHPNKNGFAPYSCISCFLLNDNQRARSYLCSRLISFFVFFTLIVLFCNFIFTSIIFFINKLRTHARTRMPIIVQVCFDCGSPFPSWCSLNNGIFLCITCSGKHRGLGTHISFVRSLSLDKFRKDQIAYFKYGGNKNGREAFRNGFATKEANDYRNELKKNVCAEFKYFLFLFSFFLVSFFSHTLQLYPSLFLFISYLYFFPVFPINLFLFPLLFLLLPLLLSLLLSLPPPPPCVPAGGAVGCCEHSVVNTVGVRMRRWKDEMMRRWKNEMMRRWKNEERKKEKGKKKKKRGWLACHPLYRIWELMDSWGRRCPLLSLDWFLLFCYLTYLLK